MYGVLWRVHAICMGLSFTAMLTGVIIQMAGKKSPRKFKIHRLLGYSGAGLAAFALVTAFILVHTSTGVHLSSLHAVIGLVTLILLSAAPISANAMIKMKNPAAKKRIRIFHIWSARHVLVLMAGVILLGLKYTGII